MGGWSEREACFYRPHFVPSEAATVSWVKTILKLMCGMDSPRLRSRLHKFFVLTLKSDFYCFVRTVAGRLERPRQVIANHIVYDGRKLDRTLWISIPCFIITIRQLATCSGGGHQLCIKFSQGPSATSLVARSQLMSRQSITPWKPWQRLIMFTIKFH